MFIDEATIRAEAGDGGNGAVSFRREKYEPRGGPSGGAGGDGGNVIIQAKGDMRTLLDFQYRTIFRADPGRQGTSKKRRGRSGKDVIIPVPPGTIIYDLDLDCEVADLVVAGQTLLVARGGEGGKGNAAFATPSRQAPRFCQRGTPGEKRHLKLSLKLLADVGVIGYPNVGKSSFISVISAAKPDIAPYHFTTLQPNLGVVKFDDFTSFVVADMPGLIVGAHQGIGLGDQFLKHIERTRLLVHVLDASGIEGRDPLEDHREINRELALYASKLADIEQIVALNKMDLPQARENLPALRSALEAEGLTVFPISAATRQGVDPLLNHLRTRLVGMGLEPDQDLPEQMHFEMPELPFRELHVERVDPDVIVVSGTTVEKIAATTDTDADESLNWLQHSLEKHGVFKHLRKVDAEEGDTIIVGDIEFFYTLSPSEETERRLKAEEREGGIGD